MRSFNRAVIGRFIPDESRPAGGPNCSRLLACLFHEPLKRLLWGGATGGASSTWGQNPSSLLFPLRADIWGDPLEVH